ncbi:MAG: glutathionylspermidine synthase family protein [Myxococcales bacterium]|nr:glutathionylspermidine synthase family protein [Polyangiaceae bacterium]MDW8249351.1 glutathionylspermidine synthase family protein [Myxococcales bacterium]
MSEPYECLAERLLDTGIFSDPWIEGHPRFRAAPVVLSTSERDELYRVAEQVAAVYNEACRVVDVSEELLDDFFKLTPAQKLMWEASRPFWHGLARADVFLTEEGPAVCELNCDTPTGEPEATLLGRLVEAPAGGEDPNGALRERVLAMVEEVTRSTLGDDLPDRRTLGIIYPTELTEDLSVVRLYRRWFEEQGWSVVLGAPYNLTRGQAGEVLLFEEPCHAILRHYKTDWWGERRPVWLDEPPFPDPDPLGEPLMALLVAPLSGQCAVINPFGAVLAQNKRMMAFFWEKMDYFSRSSQGVIRRYIPYTCRLESLLREQLEAEREQWVLKSDYGAEGDEVIVGPQTPQAVWEESLRQAAPGRWVAQRYFQARETPEGETINHGVFLVAGQASGLYARVQKGATNTLAQSAPVFIQDRAKDV